MTRDAVLTHHTVTHTPSRLYPNASLITSNRSYCHYAGVLVRSFVRYARSGLSKCKSPTFTKFGSNVQHLCQISPKNFWEVKVSVQGHLGQNTKQAVVRKHNEPRPHNRGIARFLGIDQKCNQVIPHLPWKFHANRSSRFLVILLTKKQKYKQRKIQRNRSKTIPRPPLYRERGKNVTFRQLYSP